MHIVFANIRQWLCKNTVDTENVTVVFETRDARVIRQIMAALRRDEFLDALNPIPTGKGAMYGIKYEIRMRQDK